MFATALGLAPLYALDVPSSNEALTDYSSTLRSSAFCAGFVKAFQESNVCTKRRILRPVSPRHDSRLRRKDYDTGFEPIVSMHNSSRSSLWRMH